MDGTHEAPDGLGPAGEVLWTLILQELPEGIEYDARELALLERACTCADAIDALDRVVAAEGTTTTGSRGQTVVHPALQESRQQKLVILRLLTALDLPAEDAAETPAQKRARLAAESRWARRSQGAQLRKAR
jgi:hypothetical protein